MVQIWMSVDFVKEWVFELGLVLGFSLVLAKVVDVEDLGHQKASQVVILSLF